MIPEAVDLLCIPVLMKETTLRPLDDEEAREIAYSALRIIPSPKEMEIIVISTLYYVSDLLDRSLFEELSVNSVALASLMGRKRFDGFYLLDPFKLDGLLPLPRSAENGDGKLTWAVLPIVAFGDGYIDVDEYFLERRIENELEEFAKVLARAYRSEFIKAFPPVLAEDLPEEISLIEEELERNLGVSII